MNERGRSSVVGQAFGLVVFIGPKLRVWSTLWKTHASLYISISLAHIAHAWVHGNKGK